MINAKSDKNILVTGGAGYIGSHTVIRLLESGYNVLIFDNMEYGSSDIINGLKNIKAPGKIIDFIVGDIKKTKDIFSVFTKYKISSVIHFAAYIQVEESMKNPQKYYMNNVVGSLNLLNAMLEHNVLNIVFSSSAAVYGEPQYTPIDEAHPLCPINPYGRSKLMVEKILRDYGICYDLRSVVLRYFNVIGADSRGRIGECHNPETHLVPNILLAALQSSEGSFSMYGDDFNTRDGTCIRDYIDVEDLADAHVLSLNYLLKNGESNCFNVGTSRGSTVKEVFDECEEVAGRSIIRNVLGRRAGDPEELVACNKKITDILGWKPKKSLSESIESAYRWHNSISNKK